MKNRSLNLNRIIAILIPILIFILFLTQDFFVALVEKLPPCPVYTHLHMYCPGCGNTRSVKALLHGDLITAARYNISPIIFGYFILLAYIEFAFNSFGRHIKLLPRKLRYYMIVITLLILYVSVRNFVPNMTP